METTVEKPSQKSLADKKKEGGPLWFIPEAYRAKIKKVAYVTNPTVDSVFAWYFTIARQHKLHPFQVWLCTSINLMAELDLPMEMVTDIDALAGQRYRDRGMRSATEACALDSGLGQCDNPLHVGPGRKDVILPHEKCRMVSATVPGLMDICQMLADNNNTTGNEIGGYLKGLDWSFPWLFRQLDDIVDVGKGHDERLNLWFRRVIEVPNVVMHFFASGGKFPVQAGLPKDQEVGGTLAAEHLALARDIPDVASELRVGPKFLSRKESIFTLPGLLASLHFMLDVKPDKSRYTVEERGAKIRSAFGYWKDVWGDAKKLKERNVSRAKDIFRQLIAEKGEHKLVRTPHGHVVIMNRVDNEKVAQHVWKLFSDRGAARFAEEILLGHGVDAKEAEALSRKVVGNPTAFRETVATLVADPGDRELLEKLPSFVQMPPVAIVTRKRTRHTAILTSMRVRLDLSALHAELEKLEPGRWHYADYLASDALLNSSEKVRDREATSLTLTAIIDLFSKHVRRS